MLVLANPGPPGKWPLKREREYICRFQNLLVHHYSRWLCVSFQENPQTSRCLGVFGLSLYTQERDLREVFEHYGPVDEVQVVYDHQSGRSRGFAFVYMRTHEDAMEVSRLGISDR